MTKERERKTQEQAMGRIMKEEDSNREEVVELWGVGIGGRKVSKKIIVLKRINAGQGKTNRCQVKKQEGDKRNKGKTKEKKMR